ncbi:MAG: TonB-dependent receptor [Magnetococcales bacterium]|nr:TonB-dependent receptor [Magnetococcales bacterium]
MVGKSHFLRYFSLLVVSLAMLSIIPLYAADNLTAHTIVARVELDEDDEELAAFHDLMLVLEEATTIATKTKMNSDYVPGMVTILHGADMEAKGARQVIDALALVPGLQKDFNNVVVRGIEKWGSGKVKILLNGKAINHSVTANPTPPFFLPVEAVDRIEVIRGPGSAVYGEYAFLGVINIITRKDVKRVYGRYGSYESFIGGGLYTYDNKNTGLELDINLSGFSAYGERVTSGNDILYSMGQGSVSNAPGEVVDKKRHRAAIFNMAFKDWSLEVNYLDSASGDAFGTSEALPPAEDRLIWEEGQWGVELQKDLELIADLDTSFEFGWSQYDMGMDKLTFFPAGVDLGWGPYSDGVVGSAYVLEERFHGGVDAIYRGLDKHTISTSLELSNMELIDTWTKSNFDNITMEPQSWQSAPQDEVWIKNGVSRSVVGIMVQDQYAATEQLDITGGVRFDHYDDVGNNLAPRFGLVYRLSDNHIVKAQYGQAFRPPTFFEMYSRNFVISGNPDINPETIDTYELGYIYRAKDSVGRITLFHSKLRDMIQVDGNSGTYVNFLGADLSGFELEIEHTINSNFKVDGNISYLDSKDKSTGRDIVGSANWLANAALLFQPQPDYTGVLRYHYTGKRNRLLGDSRSKLQDEHTFHLTGTVKNLYNKNLTLRGTVDNLFDADIYKPSATSNYPDDYPRPGRSWWLTLIYDF